MTVRVGHFSRPATAPDLVPGAGDYLADLSLSIAVAGPTDRAFEFTDFMVAGSDGVLRPLRPVGCGGQLGGRFLVRAGQAWFIDSCTELGGDPAGPARILFRPGVGAAGEIQLPSG